VKKFNRDSVALEIVVQLDHRRENHLHIGIRWFPGIANPLDLVVMFDQRCLGCLETPGAGPSMLVVLQVLWGPQKQRAVGCQGGEVCRRRHPLNLELSSIGHQGESEPGENKD
jgi:hypothetical protein